MPPQRPHQARPHIQRGAAPERQAATTRLTQFAGGAAAELWAAVLRRPVRSGAIAAFSASFAVIAANALFAQPGNHPAPILATRMPAPQPLADPAREAAARALLTDVQSLLARTGHYAAAIDGRPGPATTTAIRSFQAENGIDADGLPSTALLDQIRRVAVVTPESLPFVEASGDGRGGRIVEGTDSLEIGQIADVPPIAEAAGPDLVRRIQAGLTAASVAELSADGIPGERARAAIRTFEALEGMEVTGDPDRRILERLLQIGAL